MLTPQKMEAARKDALTFLKRKTAAVIATVRDNAPSASTVFFVVDDSFNFYFTTQVNTHKHENISRNANVSLVIGSGPKLISVSVQGIAQAIEGNEKIAILEKFISMKLVHWPIMEMAKFKDTQRVVYKVVPSRLSYMNLDDEDYSASKSNEYAVLIPSA